MTVKTAFVQAVDSNDEATKNQTGKALFERVLLVISTPVAKTIMSMLAVQEIKRNAWLDICMDAWMQTGNATVLEETMATWRLPPVVVDMRPVRARLVFILIRTLNTKPEAACTTLRACLGKGILNLVDLRVQSESLFQALAKAATTKQSSSSTVIVIAAICDILIRSPDGLGALCVVHSTTLKSVIQARVDAIGETEVYYPVGLVAFVVAANVASNAELLPISESWVSSSTTDDVTEDDDLPQVDMACSILTFTLNIATTRRFQLTTQFDTCFELLRRSLLQCASTRARRGLSSRRALDTKPIINALSLVVDLAVTGSLASKEPAVSILFHPDCREMLFEFQEVKDHGLELHARLSEIVIQPLTSELVSLCTRLVKDSGDLSTSAGDALERMILFDLECLRRVLLTTTTDDTVQQHTIYAETIISPVLHGIRTCMAMCDKEWAPKVARALASTAHMLYAATPSLLEEMEPVAIPTPSHDEKLLLDRPVFASRATITGEVPTDMSRRFADRTLSPMVSYLDAKINDDREFDYDTPLLTAICESICEQANEARVVSSPPPPTELTAEYVSWLAQWASVALVECTLRTKFGGAKETFQKMEDCLSAARMFSTESKTRFALGFVLKCAWFLERDILHWQSKNGRVQQFFIKNVVPAMSWIDRFQKAAIPVDLALSAGMSANVLWYASKKRNGMTFFVLEDDGIMRATMDALVLRGETDTTEMLGTWLSECHKQPDLKHLVTDWTNALVRLSKSCLVMSPSTCTSTLEPIITTSASLSVSSKDSEVVTIARQIHASTVSWIYETRARQGDLHGARQWLSTHAQIIRASPWTTDPAIVSGDVDLVHMINKDNAVLNVIPSRHVVDLAARQQAMNPLEQAVCLPASPSLAHVSLLLHLPITNPNELARLALKSWVESSDDTLLQIVENHRAAGMDANVIDLLDLAQSLKVQHQDEKFTSFCSVRERNLIRTWVSLADGGGTGGDGVSQQAWFTWATLAHSHGWTKQACEALLHCLRQGGRYDDKAAVRLAHYYCDDHLPIHELPITSLHKMLPHLIPQCGNSGTGEILALALSRLAQHVPKELAWIIVAEPPSPALARARKVLTETNGMVLTETETLIRGLIDASRTWDEDWQEALEEAKRIMGHHAQRSRLRRHRVMEEDSPPQSDDSDDESVIVSAMTTLAQLHKRMLAPARHPLMEVYQRTIGASGSTSPFNKSFMEAGIDLDPDFLCESLERVEQALLQVQTWNSKQGNVRVAEHLSHFLAESFTNVAFDQHGLTDVTRVCGEVEILKTKTRPRRVWMDTQNGRRISFLLKCAEDLRLDQRVIGLWKLIRFDDAALSPSPLQGPVTYRVVPLARRVGLVQWVEKSVPLYHVYKWWKERKPTPPPSTSSLPQPNKPSGKDGGGDHHHHAWVEDTFVQELDLFRSLVSSNNNSRLKAFTEMRSRVEVNLLRHYLWSVSEDTNDWWGKSKRFTESCGVTSAVGWMLGLGDRHLDNILLDVTTGACVHVDLNVCFDKGKHLKVPETVPFRLTPIMTATFPFFPAGSKAALLGPFGKAFQATVTNLRKSRFEIMASLHSFVSSPVMPSKTDETARLRLKLDVDASCASFEAEATEWLNLVQGLLPKPVMVSDALSEVIGRLRTDMERAKVGVQRAMQACVIHKERVASAFARIGDGAMLNKLPALGTMQANSGNALSTAMHGLNASSTLVQRCQAIEVAFAQVEHEVLQSIELRRAMTEVFGGITMFPTLASLRLVSMEWIERLTALLNGTPYVERSSGGGLSQISSIVDKHRVILNEFCTKAVTVLDLMKTNEDAWRTPPFIHPTVQREVTRLEKAYKRIHDVVAFMEALLVVGNANDGDSIKAVVNEASKAHATLIACVKAYEEGMRKSQEEKETNDATTHVFDSVEEAMSKLPKFIVSSKFERTLKMSLPAWGHEYSTKRKAWIAVASVPDAIMLQDIVGEVNEMKKRVANFAAEVMSVTDPTVEQLLVERQGVARQDIKVVMNKLEKSEVDVVALCDRLMNEAMDVENLARMFEGWMPWV